MDFELTVKDIRDVLEVINMASSRGAFKGSELLTIGQIYDKYLNILEKIISAQEQSRSYSKQSK